MPHPQRRRRRSRIQQPSPTTSISSVSEVESSISSYTAKVNFQSPVEQLTVSSSLSSSSSDIEETTAPKEMESAWQNLPSDPEGKIGPLNSHHSHKNRCYQLKQVEERMMHLEEENDKLVKKDEERETTVKHMEERMSCLEEANYTLVKKNEEQETTIRQMKERIKILEEKLKVSAQLN